MPEPKFNLRLKPELLKPDLEKRRLSVKVELVTPQFGGGAESRKPDVKQWLRSASVRGALRFWWRALFGGNYATLAQLHAAEAGIFGKAASQGDPTAPGKLVISVKVHNEASTKSWDQYLAEEDDRMRNAKDAKETAIASALSVAYFPANKSNEKLAARLLNPGVQATITLWDSSSVRRAKDSLSQTQWNEVHEALKAYLIFGGSGGRTRRGAGAICVESIREAQRVGLPSNREAIQQWITPFIKSAHKHGFFMLSHSEGLYMTSSQYPDGQRAHEALLKTWRSFRQQREHPDSWYGRKGWGSSKWPEAKVIREITLSSTTAYNRPVQDSEPEEAGKAPRAHLGLPIVFKFINEETTYDLVPKPPNKAEATGAKVDRYASPVLLAITRFFEPGQAKDGYFVGLVLITQSQLKTDRKLILKDYPAKSLVPGDWSAVLDSTQAPLGLREILKRNKFQPIVSPPGMTK